MTMIRHGPIHHAAIPLGSEDMFLLYVHHVLILDQVVKYD